MATYTVTNNDDGGDGSLRAAIEAANAHEGDDVITFDLAAGERTIKLSSGQLAIDNTAGADTGKLVIDGDLDNDGVADITVDADGTSRVFMVQGDGSADNQGATLEGLIITGGVTTGSDDGGGVRAANADLTIIGSVITGNIVGDGGYGGGVFFDDNGVLRITGSTISDNSSGEDGGGLFVEQALTGSYIERSTISGNETREESSEGGGMRLFVSTIAVTNTTISGNRTLADNSEGGGAHIDGNSVVVLTNATIADNHTYGASDSEGGGIHMLNATVTFQNAIVADNSSATDAATRDLATTDSSVVVSNGHNLFGQATVTGAIAGDLLATDPLLGELADNGGPTPTMALLPGSPAIGGADPATAPATDQRGVPRDASPDIGAFELELFTRGDDTRDLDAFDLSLFTATEATRAQAGNDTVGLSETENVGLKFFGQAGNDTIAGSLQGDRIQGDDGADSIVGRDGNDTLWGKDDADSVQGDRGSDTVYGGAGNDTVWGKDAADQAFGDAGRDTVFGGNGGDSIFGGGGNDTVHGDLGNDTVSGGDGADSVTGGQGNDVSFGGAGGDRLSGGQGADRFTYEGVFASPSADRDTITDFAPGQDEIDLTALGPLDFIGDDPFTAAGQVRAINSGGTTLLQVNTAGSGGPEMTIAFVGIVAIGEADLLLDLAPRPGRPVPDNARDTGGQSEMNDVAIVGCGLIGRAWAIAFARAGWSCRLWDPVAGAAAAAVGTVEPLLADLAEHDLLRGQTPAEVLARLQPVETLAEALAGVAWVQENAPENVETKRPLWIELDRLAPAEAVLASSSSAIVPSRFTEGLAGRQRCVVAHPLNPPYLIPATELVPSPWTSEGTMTRAAEVLRSIGQAPIVMRRELDGFVMNRMQGALLEEAWRLVADGICTAEDVDIGLREGLALRWSFMGPFETIDLNAPGGVGDYVRRYQGIYEQLFPQMQRRVDWAGPVLDEVERARRDKVPAEALARRQRWRDRRLMALAGHKRKASEDIGE